MADAVFCYQCGEKFPVSDPRYCPSCGVEQPNFQLKKTTSSHTNTLGASTGTELGRPSQAIYEELPPFTPWIYRFTPTTPEGISEGSYTFQHANRMMVDLQATSWLGGTGMTEREILDLAGSSFSSESDEVKIHPDYTHLNKSLDGYTPILWEESKFSDRFLSIIKELGVSYSSFRFGSRISVQNDDGTTTEKYLKDPIDIISAMWRTSNGLPLLEFGRVYRSDETGQEKIYWHTEALVRNRYPAKQLEPHFSNLIRIPSILQNILYLSETQFPSSMVSLPRTLSYGVEFEEADRIPKPYIQIERNCRASYVDPKTTDQVQTFFVPELTRLGYLINDDLTDDELRKFIPTMFDALCRVHEILLDGFANHSEGAELSFQARLGADIEFNNNFTLGEAGFVVPAILYGGLCRYSTDRYNLLRAQLREALAQGSNAPLEKVLDGFFDLIKLSFGEIYGHSANTLAATFVEHYDNIAESFPPLIENASNYPVDYQDVNALSNVALLWKKMNNLERAEEAIDRAILRVGSWMEAVVNQTNSMFFDSEVDCDVIDAEIYETYFAIKSQLGRVDECKKMAPQAKLLAEKTGLKDLLATANSYL